MTPRIERGPYAFEWNSDWAQLPDEITLGYTHGIAVDRQGFVHVFNQSRHGVIRFDPDGRFVSTWDEFPSKRFLGAHGMTLVEEDGEPYFWLTDQTSREVVKTTLDGETVLNLAKPPGDPYQDGAKYTPTWVAVSPVDGRIFVADGYGSSYVNIYDRHGGYLESWSGERGVGRFACCHAVWIGARPAATGRQEPAVYVTDRGNSRVQVFTLDGEFIKAFYQDYPCAFAEGPAGELLVPDLHAFVNIYDARDMPVALRLGDNQHAVVEHEGWPNTPHAWREAGKFNSPHSGCFDAEGNIYIVEWVSDGRITKLTRV